MNKKIITGVTIGAVLLIGSVSADAYYRHELAERVETQNITSASAGSLTGTRFSSKPAGLSSAANDPFAIMTAQMAHMQAQMDKMFNSTFQNTGNADFMNGQGTAQVSLKTKGKDYVVTAKIPGSKKNDINVRLSGRLLTLSTNQESTTRKTDDNGKLTQQDQYASSFQQAFTLPGPVNAADMKSTFKDGVLTLTIPKA